MSVGHTGGAPDNIMSFRIILIACIVFFILFIGIIIFSIFTPKKVAPTTTQQNDLGPNPTTSFSRPTPQMSYNKEATDELLEIVRTRPTPSLNSDITVREQLIASLEGESDVLYASPLVRIEYVSTPNDFEAEILTDEIDSAKDEAITWLHSQGLSDEGICKLPLFFYLSSRAKSNVQNSNYAFNPRPNFCQ